MAFWFKLERLSAYFDNILMCVRNTRNCIVNGCGSDRTVVGVRRNEKVNSQYSSSKWLFIYIGKIDCELYKFCKAGKNLLNV